MPEYIYLLEHRLSSAQKHALTQVREAAREAGMTVFLTGGAVRDLTTGSSVRNFDFAILGNALDLEAALTARGGELWGKHEPTRTLTFWFPGSVRVDVASARSEEYPKPGKPVYHWSTIVEDLKRRDFTANAMALSLNEGSYGLLLDPLNGVADIEARLLRVATNYGFIEDPSRLIRATRLAHRLGWQMDERTATRYENAKEAGAIKALSPYLRGYEIEKVASEEDALGTLKVLEAQGWTEHLLPGWTSAKADVAGLENLRRNWIQLLMQGVTADLTAAHLELLTAKLNPAEIDALKKAMVHPGLLRQWETLDESAKEFGKLLAGKSAASPSATWKLLTTHASEPILWLAHSRKAGGAGSGTIETKFKNFFTVWPEFRKKVPAALMLEMRITPELPGYADMLEQLFYQLIDGNLETDEQMRAFLEPYSPPAPPPPTLVRRSRAKKSESKTKRRTVAPDDDDDDDDADTDSDDDSDDAVDTDDVEDDEDEVEDDVLKVALKDLRAEEAVEVDADDDVAEDADDADDAEDADDDDDKASARPAAGPARTAAGRGSKSDAAAHPEAEAKPGKQPLEGKAVKAASKKSSAAAAKSTKPAATPAEPSAEGLHKQSEKVAAEAAGQTPAKAAAPAKKAAAAAPKKAEAKPHKAESDAPAKPPKKH